MKRIALFAFFLLCFVMGGFAQTDTEFWFAAPDLEAAHAQQPIRFCIVSYDAAATVVFEQPANSGYTQQTFHLNANDFYVYDVSSIISMVETQPYNTVLNYGFHITSTSPVSIYYESDNNNSEIYSLKGSNALGTNFVVPMQYTYENYYSNTCSRIEVVATQNNTTVTFVPSVALKGGGQAGVPINVTLNRGQSYAIEAANPAGTGHLRNTRITSTRPIAVNTSDDSVNLNTHQDLIGDQIVPNELLGTDYFAVWNNTSNEYLYFFPTENNTHIYLNGSTNPVATLNIGQEYAYQISSAVVAIHADRPISVFQMSSASNYELGGTVLPQMNCTGSRKTVYKRQNTSDLVITLIVKTSDVNGFRLNGNASYITASDFTPVPSNTTYSYCRKNVSSYVPTNGLMTLENIYNDGYFHLGILTGESGTWNYGYFSDYQPYAFAEFQMDDTYCAGETIIFNYTAENVTNLVLILPNGTTMQPPFVLNNVQPNQSGRYSLQGLGCNGTQILDIIDIVIAESEETNLNLEGCNHVFWHGHSFNQSTDTTWTVQGVTQNGCDSIYHLHVTVHYDENITLDPVEACDSYTWHGHAYTHSGFYDYQTTTQYGCLRTEHLPLTIHYSDTVDYNVTACEEYLWYGQTYTQSGTYNHNTTNSYGCNRLERLHLTISDSYREVTHVTECDSYFWPLNQQWYYGNALDSIIVEGGAGECDSTFVLDLTLHYADTLDLDPVTACESYEWYGQTYTESGTYGHPTTNEYGCDRLERLMLTINHDTQYEFNVVSCDPYEWFGQVYTSPGTYEHHLTNSQGCDSLILMHFEIGGTNSVEEFVESCSSYRWHGTTYTESGDYEYFVEFPDACDSLYKLHLEIYPAYDIENVVFACEPFQWQEYYCDHSGDYRHVFTTPQGCDSIVTMHVSLAEAAVQTQTIEACAYYDYNGVIYDQPGEYFLDADTIASALGCDSLINITMLKLVELDQVTEVEGYYNVYVASNFVSGIYTYEIDATGIIGEVSWSLSNPDWRILESGQTWCRIMAATPGTVTLSAKFREECSEAEHQFIITAGFFGLDEQTIEAKIYPNPTKGIVTIEADRIIQVRVVDMLGQVVENREFGPTDSVTLNLGKLAPAAYMLEIKTVTGAIMQRVVLDN